MINVFLYEKFKIRHDRDFHPLLSFEYFDVPFPLNYFGRFLFSQILEDKIVNF